MIWSDDFSPKLFWNYIKNKKNDRCGVNVAPLKRNGLIFSDSGTKANITNSQFFSVFSTENTTNLPDLGPGPSPDIHPIHVTKSGVYKTQSPQSIIGPVNIPARLLKATADEIQHLPLFTKHQSTKGKYHLTGKERLLHLCSRRGIGAKLPTIGLSHSLPSVVRSMNTLFTAAL